MNWLRNFMYGRHGTDQLNFALLILSVLITGIASFISVVDISLIAYIPLILCLLRMFSKNIDKRRKENLVFLKFWNPIVNWFKQKMVRLKNSKTYRYYSCPSCKQTLRVPKGKGQITITCPKCKLAFIKKT